MTALITDGIPLADVAKVTKTTIAELEAECRQLIVFIGRNWADRPAVSAADAHALVTGAARRQHDHSRAWHDYAEQAEAWTKARDGAYMDATRLAGQKAADRVEAGRAAAREYEQTHPMPTWVDGATPLTECKYLDEGGALRRLGRLVGVS